MPSTTSIEIEVGATSIFNRRRTWVTRARLTPRCRADSPTLMRLRELEVLEKIPSNGKLNIVLGDKGLADKVVNLL